jgi:hypothetical protein
MAKPSSSQLKDNRWTLTKVIASGSLAVVTLVLSLFGALIVAVTGIPGAGGVINLLITPAMTMICLFVINKTGSATIMFTVLSILELPFPLTGTPGFLGKIPILIIAGILSDLIYLILKKNKIVSSLVIGAIGQLFFAVSIIEIGRLMNIPGIEMTAKLVYSPNIIAIAVMGSIGGYIGYAIYQKIKDTSVVKRIQR